jgi:DNA-binding transcriptional ArsR family regulator
LTIELRLTAEDRAQLRFGVSPLSELLTSLAVLHWPAVHPQYRRWVSATEARIHHLDRELLMTLVPPGGPRASLPLGDAHARTTISDQLQAVAECPPELISAELELVWRGRIMPAAGRRVIADGPAGARRIADVLADYWELAMAPYWPVIRSVIEGEIARGANRLAEGGVRALLADLHPSYEVTDDAVRVVSPDLNWTVDGTGRGTLLLPSVFTWPHGTVDTGMNGPPSLIYGPRQACNLWDSVGIGGNTEPLKELLGRSRAVILRSVRTPKSTTELARDLQQSPAAVSAHLSTLANCGLATSWRSGRYVLYQATPLADRLIAMADETSTELRR